MTSKLGGYGKAVVLEISATTISDDIANNPKGVNDLVRYFKFENILEVEGKLDSTKAPKF